MQQLFLISIDVPSWVIGGGIIAVGLFFAIRLVINNNNSNQNNGNNRNNNNSNQNNDNTNNSINLNQNFGNNQNNNNTNGGDIVGGDKNS